MSDGFDTALARFLDQSQLVERGILQQALQEVRARRSLDSSLNLGVLLLSQGCVSAPDLDRAIESVAAQAARPASGGAPLHFGPYRVLRLLGEGGMGKVYAVEHVETRRQEALKTMSRLLPEQIERFRREAEVLASLDHPGLIRVYGADLEAREPYLTLELCTGGSLQDRLRSGPLPLDELLRLAESLSDALDHLHARGALHRDLKPDNVLFDGAGRAKLADFGLASLRGASGLTATGEIVGTPAFMAPEQAGRAHQADERSDVYGLAATLYAAATGRPPFLGTGLFDVLSKVLEEAPDSPKELGVRLPADVEAAILRALSKDPDERQESAGAFLLALRGSAPRSPAQRRRLLRPLVLLALLIGLALAVAALLAAFEAPNHEPSPRTSPRNSLASSPALTPLSALPPGQAWSHLAKGRGSLSPAEFDFAWRAVVDSPPTEALEPALARRPGGDSLVAYLRLLRGRPVQARAPRLVLWTDLEQRRLQAWERYCTREALQRTDLNALSELRLGLKEFLPDYQRLVKEHPLPPPLLDLLVGRFQRFYFHARFLLKTLNVRFGTEAEDLQRVLALSPRGLTSLPARFAYYNFAFDLDAPWTGGNGLAGRSLDSPAILDRLALALYEVANHPDANRAERRATWLAKEANAIGITTQSLAVKAFLTLNSRLRAQAVRERRGELFKRARQALEGAATDLSHLYPRQVRYQVTQAICEGESAEARRYLKLYDANREALEANRLETHDQARGLLEGQILLLEGRPREALRVVRAARGKDNFRMMETLALEAHALKLLEDPAWRERLRGFEEDLKRNAAPGVGLDWYLLDAAGVIEGRAWWPRKGPLPESR